MRRRSRSPATALICAAVASIAPLLPAASSARCKEADLHSGNIERHLSPAATHPLVGFWRSACEDAWGLAIDQAGPRMYTIYFCGPGGCFEPGTYRPDSPILGDPAYRVVGANELEVLGADGFSTYLRCNGQSPSPAI